MSLECAFSPGLFCALRCMCCSPHRSCRCALGPTLPSWAAAAGGEGDSVPHQKGQKVFLSSGKKAGFTSDLKLQHSSLPDPFPAGTSADVSQLRGFPKLNSFSSLSAGKFRVHWNFFIFVVRGKQILISLFYVYNPLSPLLIFSGSALIYRHRAAFVKQYHKVRKRTFPKDYSKINYFRRREAA